MFKYLVLAVVLSACSCQVIVQKDILGRDKVVYLNDALKTRSVLDAYNPYNPYNRIVGGHAATVLTADGRTVIAQDPRTVVLGGAKIVSHDSRQVYLDATPNIVQHIAGPRRVFLDTPKVLVQEFETPKPYSFGYQSTDEYGNQQARSEAADGTGAVKGSYSMADNEGKQRIVDYVADAAGFRAAVRTNEPGTANADPADVQVASDEGSAAVLQAKGQAYAVKQVRLI